MIGPANSWFYISSLDGDICNCISWQQASVLKCWTKYNLSWSSSTLISSVDISPWEISLNIHLSLNYWFLEKCHTQTPRHSSFNGWKQLQMHQLTGERSPITVWFGFCLLHLLLYYLSLGKGSKYSLILSSLVPGKCRMHTMVLPTRAPRHSKSQVRHHKNNNTLTQQYSKIFWGTENILRYMKTRRMVLFDTAVNLSLLLGCQLFNCAGLINTACPVSGLIAFQMCCVKNPKQNIMTWNGPGWHLDGHYCELDVVFMFTSFTTLHKS